MRIRLRDSIPEIGLILLTLFFAFRELGTFPAAWGDDGLYMLTAKTFAIGHGYSLPILHQYWAYPYLISIGPTVILPVAFLIHIFGFSVITARLVSACYLLLTCCTFYALCTKMVGQTSARWSTALLISLSAFINTGKPVLGTVPAFFFLALGLLCLLQEKKDFQRSLMAGLCFGICLLTKLTYFFLIPSIGAAWIYLLWKREWKKAALLSITESVALLLSVPWLFLQAMHQPGFDIFIRDSFLSPSQSTLRSILQGNWVILWRIPYIYFAVLLGIAIVGLRQIKRLSTDMKIFLVVLLSLFVVYFLNGNTWYRHLLPAHLLLLPFVPIGAAQLFGKRKAAVILSFFILAQGLWQLDHRGSSQSTIAEDVATYIQTHYADRDLIIQASEVYVRLPENPHWLFWPMDANTSYFPSEFHFTPSDRCLPIVRKINAEDQRVYGKRLQTIVGSFAVLLPLAECPAT